VPLEPTGAANASGRSLTTQANVQPSSWYDRWLAIRDGLLASRRFQRWAARFPLTRPIARRRARDLFDVCAGFVYSQVLFACVQVRLFDVLRDGPLTVDAISARLSMTTAATRRLLAAAASLRLVEGRSQSRFGLGVLGAAVAGNPGIAAMVEHHALLYADLRDPVALLRGERHDTAIGRFWSYAGAAAPGEASDGDVAAYSALMSVSQSMLADDVIDAYPFARHRCLLDVGGGEGIFLTTVAARAPRLRLMLFDLPAVAARAEARFASQGLADRAVAMGGDFGRDRLPLGADVASVVRVLHDHDDRFVLEILRAIYAVLPPGGTLLVAEPMSDNRSADPVGDAYFGFYLMAMGSGRPRQPGEIANLLVAAGFRDIQPVRTRQPMLTKLMIGRRPQR
jgi:demethylspheroidene O-methyltransferase